MKIYSIAILLFSSLVFGQSEIDSSNSILLDTTLKANLDTIAQTELVIEHQESQLPIVTKDSLENKTEVDTLKLNLNAQAHIEDTLILSISESIEKLIKNNPDIAEARELWIAKKLTFSASWGDFEPKLVGRYNKQNKGPSGALISEVKDEYKLTIQGNLITGTQYDVGFNQTNYTHSTEKSNLFLGATIKQPIAKGIWFGSLWANQVIAKLDEKKAYQEYRLQLSKIIEQLLKAYWNYYYYNRVLDFEKQSVNVAQSLYNDGEKRLIQGKLSKLDLNKAYAELSIRLSRLLEATSMEREAKHELALLLADPTILIEENLVVNPDILNLGDSIESKQKFDSLSILSPNQLIQQIEIERLKIIKKAQIDQALPSINLVGSYGISASNRSTSMAIETFKDPDFRDRILSGGIEIEIPILGNHKGRKTVQATDKNIRAAQIRESLIIQQITQLNQILNTRSIELKKQVYYERTSVKYYEDELTSELRKLEAGKSSYHQVFEVEEKLRDAQRKEFETTREFELNSCKLKLNNGSLLLNYNIETNVQGAMKLRSDLLESIENP